MSRLLLALVLSSLGGTFLLHYLKNFFLEEKVKFAWDWDGWLERLSLTWVLIQAPGYWPVIPAIILLKVFYRLTLIGSHFKIGRVTEGLSPQKVLFKGELAFDLIVSPLFAVLVGALLR